MVELQPIAPSEALDFYLAQREDELAFETHRSHRYRLESFVEWCEGTEIDNMNSLTARHIHKFRLYRKEEQDIGKVTVRTQFSTIRIFVKFLESIEGVEQGLHEKILVPSMEGREDVRDRMIERPRPVARDTGQGAGRAVEGVAEIGESAHLHRGTGQGRETWWRGGLLLHRERSLRRSRP